VKQNGDALKYVKNRRGTGKEKTDEIPDQRRKKIFTPPVHPEVLRVLFRRPGPARARVHGAVVSTLSIPHGSGKSGRPGRHGSGRTGPPGGRSEKVAGDKGEMSDICGGVFYLLKKLAE